MHCFIGCKTSINAVDFCCCYYFFFNFFFCFPMATLIYFFHCASFGTYYRYILYSSNSHTFSHLHFFRCCCSICCCCYYLFASLCALNSRKHFIMLANMPLAVFCTYKYSCLYVIVNGFDRRLLVCFQFILCESEFMANFAAYFLGCGMFENNSCSTRNNFLLFLFFVLALL